jgi:predicted amidohydrolase
VVSAPLRVAAVQFKGDRYDVAGARLRLAALAERACADADLVVLPEMAASGYLFYGPDDVARVAEHARGPGFEQLAPLAQRYGTYIVGGFAERAGDRYYNAARVIGPDGALLFTYRKTLLYEADLPWATPGDSGYRTFDTDFGRFAVGICMDLNDDRFTRWVAGSGADLLAFPTNWVCDDDGVAGMRRWWRYRLMTCPITMVAANTWGVEDDTRFVGCSCVLDPASRTLAATGPTGDAVVHWAG